MPRIRLNLHKLSVTQKIAKAEQIVAALTGNPSFPTPSPTLASITAAANELKTANADVLASTSALAVFSSLAAAVMLANVGDGVGKLGLPVSAATICSAFAIFCVTDSLCRLRRIRGMTISFQVSGALRA